jgi:2-keto-4-pentenoate hydratase/2-oxohepta-3-ene-1,7-dioic acid hydratase in catechol pathway
MRYAKVMGRSGPGYCAVEERDGAWWASSAIAGPEEDPLAVMEGFQAAPLDMVTVLAPVRPSKIVCVGRNYRDHAAELGHDVPVEPLIFLKPPSSLLAPGGVIEMPAESKRVDFEGELGIVIGRRCRNFQPGKSGEDVRSYIRGYVLVNDVTARDLQKSDAQWTRGKGFDSFCPVGPLVSDEIDPIGGSVTLTTRVNGELRQTGNTADFIFAIPELLRYISSFMTLQPGDLIPTGTPAGVGGMQAGDTVEVAIAGLGVLRNRTAEAGTKA